MTHMDDQKALIHTLNSLSGEGQIEVDGVDLHVTNLDKEIARGVTKRDLIRYAIQIAPWIMPHVQDRPLTLTRYPNGISSTHFFQKDWVAPLPPSVDRITIASQGSPKRMIHALVIQNMATLVWLANLANIECHTWYSRAPKTTQARNRLQTLDGLEKSSLNQPDFIVFDLDPSISREEHARYKTTFHAIAYRKTCEVAHLIRAECMRLKLHPFIKTSGKTGLHIYVPVQRGPTYAQIRGLANEIARRIVAAHPEQCTVAWNIEERGSKVFIDVNQNARGRTLAAPYSLRPTPDLRVSMPLTWEEAGSALPTAFTWKTVPKILERKGDAWEGIMKNARRMPAV